MTTAPANLKRLRVRTIVWRLFLATAGLAAIYGFWIEPASIRSAVYRLDLQSARAAPLEGMRVAIIADLHAGAPYIGKAKIDQIVRLTNATKADLILLAGDYVGRHVVGHHYISAEAIASGLRPLHARLGVYAILGNHDYWDEPSRIADAFRRAGIRMLLNEPVTIHFRDTPFYLVGIDDFVTGHDNLRASFRAVPQASSALCLTHSPDVFPQLPSSCVLTIAGHTHGGQVDLPIVGRLIVPSKFGQQYAAGLKREGDKVMFVSTGIGTSIIPVRFAVPPEISVIDIAAPAKMP